MFAVAFVLFLLGSGCARDVRGQNVAGSRDSAGDYFACGEDRDGTPTIRLDGCTETKGSDGKHNINCSGKNGGGFANLTDCTSTGDPTVLYTGCSAVVIDSRGYNLTGPIDIFVSNCFVHPDQHNENECGSVDPGQPHNRPKNCTEVLSEYEKRKPAPTNNGNAPTTEDKKESPKQKQNDGPATSPQRSEVNATEQNRPTSVERNESREVTTPHTSTSSGTVLLTGLHARVFCVLQLLRLLK
ncbi:hypothetical protein ERJ75_000474000 [Trypanosoma vivax]|nr:hypothetical protein ERJ75_000474000 [Trypanosoma vivax]